MKAIKDVIKGVSYQNPQLGESLYELCRRATSRHIDRPDEILNQQVVYMINSEMHTPYAAKDACTCLKRRLQMDHPQKRYLAIILTSKVLQDCYTCMSVYQGELLQEVAYILRTTRSSGPAAARTRQVAMDVLRHFGSAGQDAYRQARQQGVPMGAPQRIETVNKDPAAVAAERASLLDEIKRMCEQAGASTEILNELILNKQEPGAGSSAADANESIGLRKELLADVAELRKLFDLYMEQLASLTGSDAEEAMKAALEAVDMLDNALTLEKDVDAELKDLQKKGQLPPPTAEAAATATAGAGTAGAGSSAAAASAGAAADAAAAKMQSVNLIDLDDEPPATAAAGAAAAGPVDPFAPPPMQAAPPPAAPLDPFAPAPAAAQATADPFSQLSAGTADPFAALAVSNANPPNASQEQQQQQQPYPGAPAADPFAEPSPWGAPSSAPAAPAPGMSVPVQQPQGPHSAGGVPAASSMGLAASGFSVGSPPGSSLAVAPGMPGSGPPSVAAAGGYMAAPAAAGAYGAPVTPGYGSMPVQGMAAPYSGYAMQQMPMQQMPPNPYGMPPPYGMPGAGPAMYSPQPTGMPYSQQVTGQYPSPYPAPYPQQQQQMAGLQQQQQQQQAAGGPYGQAAAPPAASVQGGSGGGSAADAASGLSPSNPFAAVAPAAAAGGVANPFQAVSAGGMGPTNVEQEWNTFFSSSRPSVSAAK